jgi:hypothetical protein
MKTSQFFSLRRLLFGFTAVTFLVSVLAPTTAVYAGSDDPKDLQKKTLTKKLLPTGVDAEVPENRFSATAALLWLRRGDALYAKKSYVEALGFYEKAAGKGREKEKKKARQAEQQKQRRDVEAQKRAAEEEKLRLAIPPVARGYEAIYQRFSKGILVYLPEPGSDVGKIELPIAELANPLEGTFDLSRCGDAGKYLSIATGYRKGKIAANASKLEIWITPRFLIEKNLQGNASHFKDIMGNWDATKAPLGAFYTWGGWDDLGWYDYATTQDFDTFSKEDFYGKWYSTRRRSIPPPLPEHRYPHHVQLWKKFHVYFITK